MTLLDDVARAIFEAGQKEELFKVSPDAMMYLTQCEMADAVARAAIAVFARYLREPSEELIFKVTPARLFGSTQGREGCREILRALAAHLEKEMG